MSTVPQLRFTPEEYLERERQAPTKSEYYQGEIFAMAGASREHILVVANLTRVIGNQLLDRPCEVYPIDMRVKVSATGLYTYPDLAIVYGPPRLEDRHGDTLLNPPVLIEVLSESTEAYDRGAKAGQYRRIPSLQELVLVAQDRPHIERYTRQPDGQWLLAEAQSLDESITLSSLAVTLPLVEVYCGIEFPPPDAAVEQAGIG